MKYKISIPVFFKVNSNTLKCSIDLKKIKMKKNYFLGKNLLILLTGSLIATSCMTDAESPVIQDDQVEIALEDIGQTGEENLRKGWTFQYVDTFQNQIIPTPTNDGVFLPGEGVGKASRLGKSYSFINQVVTGPITSEGAPVTMFFFEELVELGIDLEDLTDNISTVVVNGGEHALFMESKTNFATPVSNERIEFQAEVIIVGGTKKYKGVTGTGQVTGWYNPNNGQGQSTVSAEITLKE
ncbi:hypothetical protein [Algoriphagus limi]|uniref:Uncharacterized protein n=1 Tax=Algoriphagus limi TaxID=2975273 RepID=A0ABT2G438_9BACT|nr:hypothetical protein [Algoriphagus limi]MCS5489533.1 hypothetical protein [Algoriphagus limi]